MNPISRFQLKIARVFCVWLLCAMARVALCADVPQGKVIWWGRDIRNPNADRIYRPQTNGVVESDEEIVSNVVSIAGDLNHGLLLRSDGTVITVGHFFGGIPVPAGLSNVESIAMAGGSCWAMKRDGTVVRWERDGGNYRTDVFSGLNDITAVVSLSPGSVAYYQSYLAPKKDGSVQGILAPALVAPTFDPITGITKPHSEPVSVGGRILTNVAGIALMGSVTVILRRDGTVVQLAPPSTPPQRYAKAEPVMVDGQALTNVMSIAGAGMHCLALKSNGTVVAWGDSGYDITNVPAGLSNVTAIAAAQDENLALKGDGTVVAWGENYIGQTSVPSGLSHVVEIAAAGEFNMALTTGAVPASVFITPHGRLEEMARKADLIFKGQAISSERITNAAFTVSSLEVYRTRFKVISVLQGEYTNEFVEFEHYAGWAPGGHNWSGPREPAFYKFEPGQSYIVHAANLARNDRYSYYQPGPNITNKPDEFREVADSPNQDDDGVIRTLDARPVKSGSLREAAWDEFNLLLNDVKPTNQLYAIQHLDWMSPLCNAQWGHSEDFKRERVLRALQPFLESTNDEVAIAAIHCFGVGHECATQLDAYVPDLIRVADNSEYSVSRRVAAIAVLGGNGSPEITNALTRWLKDQSEDVRSQAVLLLPDFPGEYSEAALREAAADASPKVRASVADAIGNGKIQSLLPTLETLLKDPVGLTNPLPPLTMDELQSGGTVWGGNNGDVHTAAGYALLKFDADQVSGILRSNLNDPGFRLNYLCKLAEKDAGPWLPDLAAMMEARRARIQKQADEAHVEPKASYFEALMTLSGTYFRCWNIMHDYLDSRAPEEFADHKMDRYLDVLENAGTTGSQEPVKLYELYRRKGLNERAAAVVKRYPDYKVYFNQADERLKNSAGK